ncbi:DUF1343 domain-containing protein [Ammoniphilus sp. YIM 78166]|uniref:exo-beta-N-acetylmuramidase NamZ family protein n=1 Tax=Ammoniphilus sp. YIM 78166 TaxID=1644106 RepID=UPI00106F330C
MKQGKVGLLVVLCFFLFGGVGQAVEAPLRLGIEVLLEEQLDLVKGKKVGLITNPTGVDRWLKSIVDVLHEHPDVELKAIFGPEHGARGDVQDGKKVDSSHDEQTGVPVYSLYGETKKPTSLMLEDIDVLLFDIQDVGVRYYTYIYTMAYAMEAARENEIPFVVLDRPNPLGGNVIEGPVLESEFSSFVGRYPIPLRHGMTVGELAQLFNEEFGIGCDLTVVKMKGWERHVDFSSLGLPWVPPSPNMPTAHTALVYAGTALLEGTNLSEGRGTTKPFELVGAPFVDGVQLARKLNDVGLPGVLFREAYFTPEFSKYKGEACEGVQIHVVEPGVYEPLKTGLAIVKAVYELYPNEMKFRSFFNQLIGNEWVMEEIKRGASVDSMVSRWQEDLKQFRGVRKDYSLY